MRGEVLDEAYVRFDGTGPEWGEDQLTNHGPMAAEVLIRRGQAAAVDRWIDLYIRRLEDLPAGVERLTDQNWRDAIGDGRRIGDWTAYFTEQLSQRPWRDVLSIWWPRLLPGIVAGTTHGVIRVGHAVRALLAGAESEPTLRELAHGLAFWAARSQAVPVAAVPAGELEPAAALDGVPRVPHQRGPVASRFGQLPALSGWPRSVAALRSPADPADAKAQLANLVTAATVRYLSYGHASPILLVHTATAPNAVLHVLPALPRHLWAPSLAAIWATTAAIFSSYAPEHAESRTVPPDTPTGPDGVAEAIDRATAHGNEHVIKFADTASEVYTRTGDPQALAAALHVGTLVDPPAGWRHPG